MPLDMLAVERAVAGSREGLAESGFDMECADREGVLRVTVRARPDACEECLVPKAVFAAILGRELEQAGMPVRSIDVVYPAQGPAPVAPR